MTAGEEITYSKEEQTTADYLSIQGINTRFMLDGTDFDIFIIKETLDNALDSIEENAKEFVNGQKPYVKVFVTEEEDGKVTKIRIRNSYPVINDRVKIFTKDQLINIFNLTQYYSSKRHRHQINRGELGDAFKAILCIPYAIAVNDDNDDERGHYYHWNYPLKIINSKDHKSFNIRIDNINKLRRKEQIGVSVEDNDLTQDSDHNYIEIVVYLPNTKKAVDYSRIRYFFNRYALSNTHINFEFEIPKKVVVNEQFKLLGSYHFVYKATQELKKDWKNKLSIYSYSISDWKSLIRSIDNNKDKVNVYDDFIHPQFREGWTLNRDDFFESLTLEELKNDDKKMEIIYHKLRNNSKVNPINEKSTSQKHLELPFEMNKKTREQALKERLKQIYKIDEDSFIYKKFDRWNYENKDVVVDVGANDVIFPYTLEIVMAKTPDLNRGKRLALIESLNCSPSLHVHSLFEANDNVFSFEEKNGGGDGYDVHNIIQILHHCKYSLYDEKHHKKDHNLIVLNLISPRIDYRSHSKSRIELKPFGSIGQDIYNVCKSPRSNNNKNKNTEENTDSIHHLKIWLKNRLEAVLHNENLLTTGRIPINGIYYRLRTELDRKGIKIATRKHILNSIKLECEKMGYKRHELGIIAAERAQLYFRGELYGVGIDEIPNLAQVGTDLIIIEKEGAVEALRPFADKHGIALIYTRGFLTEYVIELSKKSGSNIAILTDFDASELLIAIKVQENKNIHRIGVDTQMIDALGLDIDDIKETYEPDQGHYNTVVNYVKDNNYNLVSKERLKWLSKYRVEIDSILGLVENEVLWNYLIEQLDTKFPTRDYNRSVKIIKDVILPKRLQNFISDTIIQIGEFQASELQKIKTELANFEGFFEEDIESKEEEIKDRLRSIVENNPKVDKMITENFNKKFLSS